MRFTSLIAVVLGTLALFGCDKGKPNLAAGTSRSTADSTQDMGCTSPTAVSLVQELVAENVESEARAANKGLPEERRLDLGKVRANAGSLRFELTDVITTQNDPNSTRKYCDATLTIRVPSATLDAANQRRKDLGRNRIQSLAEDADFKVDLDKFSRRVSYTVQPTDDGTKLYLALDNDAPVKSVTNALVLFASLNSPTEQAAPTSIQEAAMAAPAAAPAPAPAPAPSTASEPVRPAAVAVPAPATVPEEVLSSTAAFEAAEKEINQIWRALPKDVREANLQAQRAFNASKEATCFKEASAAPDSAKFEAVKNRCWARFYQRRIPELKALGSS